MFVLRECKSCSGRTKASTDVQTGQERSVKRMESTHESDLAEDATQAAQQFTMESAQNGFSRKQASNFMWF